MTRISDLIGFEMQHEDVLGVNPLRDPQVLREAYFVHICHDVVHSRVQVILDCRFAAGFTEANTGLLILEGVSDFTWHVDRHGRDGVEYTIGRWSPNLAADGDWSVLVLFERNGELVLKGRRARFFLLDVPGMDDAPPDFGSATAEEVRAGLPDWDSDGRIVQMTSTPPVDL